VIPQITGDNWLGGTGNWSVAGNWSAGVPGVSSAVTIGNTSSGNVTEDLASARAASLSMLAGNILTITSGNTLAVSGATTVDFRAQLNVNNVKNGGSGGTMTSGAFTDTGLVAVGNPGNTGASKLTITGTLTNAGGTMSVLGGKLSSAGSLVKVSGAAPSTLTGAYKVESNIGSAAVEFGSGGVTTIGAAAGGGSVTLRGPNAYFEIGATNSNSALTSLSRITSNGAFSLSNGASFTTIAGLSNAGELQVGDSSAFRTSTLNVTGSLANTGNIVAQGGRTTAGNSLINVPGAVPSTLTGAYFLNGSVGSAAVEFGSGKVTSIGDGMTNDGRLYLTGPNAYFEVGATKSNSALTSLSTIASNGQLVLGDGASLTTTGALSNANWLFVDETGSGGSTLTVGGSLTNTSSIQLGNGIITAVSTLTVTGTLTNTRSIVVYGGNTTEGNAVLNVTGPSISNSAPIFLLGNVGHATLQIGSNVTLSGTGTVVLHDAKSLITGSSPSFTFTNSSTIQGTGTISNMGIVNSGTLLANHSKPLIILPSSAGLNNTGTLSVGSRDTMQIGTSSGGALKNFSGNTLTGGTYLIGGTLQFGAIGTGMVTNAANVTLTGAGSQIIDFGGGNILAHFATNAAAGTFTLAGTQSQSLTTSGGSFTNAGIFTVNTGSTFTVGGTSFNFTQTGGTSTIDGTLTNTSTGKLSVNGGSLFGGGTLGYAVTDAATITPGDSATKTGMLTVGRTYTQSAAGALDIAIGGTTVGTQYDQLKVNKSASLGGTLNVSLINGFIPTIGSTFAIVNAGSRSGTFGQVNGLGINSSEHFSISYTGTGAMLTVVAGAAPVQNSADYGKTNARGIHMMIAAAPRRFRTADLQPAEQAIAPPIAPVRGLSSASLRPMTGSPSPYGNAKRFECGVDVKELLKTSPKRIWKSWLADPMEPSPVGYVMMTH
jgi:hypothetical protein